MESRSAPLEMTGEQFRALGHELVDRIGAFLDSMPGRPVTPAGAPGVVRAALESERGLPEEGAEPATLLRRAGDLLFEHSLFNGHPRFYGYVTSSPAPMGMLADLLASAVNSNVGAWKLSPMASEIELQVVRWLAEFIGYPSDCAGLLVSGGNMANLTCFLAARAARAGWNIREQGVAGGPRLAVYASSETHTWIQKAADLAGLGTGAIRWIRTDAQQRLDLNALEVQYRRDVEEGFRPFLVAGSAGTVSTGAIDPLADLSAFCTERGLWFHIDGAYGAFAAGVRSAAAAFRGIELADSIAVDPHKWLYAPLEAGCALVRHRSALRDAFSYHPAYYNFEQEGVNFFDIGPQNSRGFRALKVWLALQHAGAAGYRVMIADDIAVAGHLFQLAEDHPELEALTHQLSITTLRYVPPELRAKLGARETEEYLNRLNQRLQDAIEQSGEAFLSNAVVDGKYALRACVVNFRASAADMEEVQRLIVRLGREVHRELSAL